MKTCKKLVAAAIFALSLSANAITVFDPSNYFQNLMTAQNSITGLRQQLMMFEQMRQGNMNFVRDMTNSNDTQMQVRALTQSTDNLSSKIGNAQTVFGNAQSMYGAGKYQSWGEFGQAIQRRSAAGEASAAALVRSAEVANRQLIQANESHARLTESLTGVQGATEASQTTTAAVNVLIDQNNSLLGLISAKNTVDGNDAATKQAKEDAAAKAAMEYGQRTQTDWQSYKSRFGL